jgi:hypothetical protein
MNPSEQPTVPEEDILAACGKRELPAMGVIKQVWETDPILSEEIPRRVRLAIEALAFEDVPDGGEVAIGVGSRGIANLVTIVHSVVDVVRETGYEPFVFPAMGSHGGATAGGQREMLSSLGVTEDVVGCEIPLKHGNCRGRRNAGARRSGRG